MRMLWILVRVALIVLALGTLSVTVFFTGPSGTTIDPGGAVVDAAALAVIIACVVTLRRDLRRPAV